MRVNALMPNVNALTDMFDGFTGVWRIYDGTRIYTDNTDFGWNGLLMIRANPCESVSKNVTRVNSPSPDRKSCVKLAPPWGRGTFAYGKILQYNLSEVLPHRWQALPREEKIKSDDLGHSRAARDRPGQWTDGRTSPNRICTQG
jgi:hypothetical protein